MGLLSNCVHCGDTRTDLKEHIFEKLLIFDCTVGRDVIEKVSVDALL